MAKKYKPSEVFNGTDSDIHREKRLNNYLRSYLMPSALGEQVQQTMIANPYDRSAGQRMELAQSLTNSLRMPQPQRDAMASALFGAVGPQYHNGDGAAPGSPIRSSSNSRGATPSAGPVATRGSINGREIAVPTAGNYLNGAFNAEMNRLGAGDMDASNTPSWKEYQRLVYDNSPESRQAAMLQAKLRSDERIAAVNAGGQVDAAKARGPAKGNGRAGSKTEYDKNSKADQKQLEQMDKELGDGYERYFRDLQKNASEDQALSYDEWISKDPIAGIIKNKFQKLGERTGRVQREDQALTEGGIRDAAQVAMAGANSGMGNGGSSAAGQFKEVATQSVRAALSAGATPEQILARAESLPDNDGQKAAKLEAVRQAMEEEKILRAQYASPAQPGAKKSNAPVSSDRGVDNSMYAAKNSIYSGAQSVPTGRARGGDGVASPYAPQGTASPITRATPSPEEAWRMKNAQYQRRAMDGSVVNVDPPTFDPYIDYRGFPGQEQKPVVDQSLLQQLIQSLRGSMNPPHPYTVFPRNSSLTS